MAPERRCLKLLVKCIMFNLLLFCFISVFRGQEPTRNTLKNIFMLETKVGKRSLNPRVACSMESAAFHHPYEPVTLYNINDGYDEDDRHVNNLLNHYPNIRFSRLDTGHAFSGTPLETWNERNAISKSQFPVEHLSDALRIALLWKHGGIYMDTDTIVTKPLDHLTNAIGMEFEYVTIGVMVFQKHSVLLYNYMKAFEKNFHGLNWSDQGAVMISILLARHCNVTSFYDVINRPSQCHGIDVLPQHKFYPYLYIEWEFLFFPPDEHFANYSDWYTVHLYRKFSGNRTIAVGGDTVMEFLFKTNCPRTYRLMQQEGFV